MINLEWIQSTPVALAMLFGIQFVVSYLRSRSNGFAHIVDNVALLLMAGSGGVERPSECASIGGNYSLGMFGRGECSL